MASGLTTVNDSSEGKLVHESHNDHRLSGTDQHQTTSAKELEDNTSLYIKIFLHTIDELFPQLRSIGLPANECKKLLEKKDLSAITVQFPHPPTNGVYIEIMQLLSQLRQQPQNYHLTNRYVGQVFQQLDPALAAAVGSPQNAFKKVSRIYQSRRKLSYDTFPTYRRSESSNSSPTSCQSHQQQSLQPPQSPTSLPTSTSLATLPGFTPSLPLQQPPRRTSST